MPTARHASRPSPAESLEPSPPDSILGRHHANLSSLSAELAALQRLFDMWWTLDQELTTAEAAVEGTVEAILEGTVDDQALSQKSDGVASFQAQIKAVRKKATVSGTTMQLRLQKDGPSVERLVAHWLAYRLETETAKLLETLPPQKRETLREAATEFARAGIAYVESEKALVVHIASSGRLIPLRNKGLYRRSQKPRIVPRCHVPTHRRPCQVGLLGPNDCPLPETLRKAGMRLPR